MPAGSLRFIRPPTPASLAAEVILKAGRRNSHIACRRDAPRKILAFSLILLTPS